MKARFAFIVGSVAIFAAAFAIHADESVKPAPSTQSAARQPTTTPTTAAVIRTKDGFTRVKVNGVVISDTVLAEAILIYNRNNERADEVRRRSGIANATILSDELTAAIERYERSGHVTEAEACKSSLAEIQQKISEAEAGGRKPNPTAPRRRARPEEL